MYVKLAYKVINIMIMHVTVYLMQIALWDIQMGVVVIS